MYGTQVSPPSPDLQMHLPLSGSQPPSPARHARLGRRLLPLGRLGLLGLLGCASTTWAADPDLINETVLQDEGDPRHAIHLGALSYVRGDEEEKAQLLGALGQIEAMFQDSSLWLPDGGLAAGLLESFGRVAPVVRSEIDHLTQDIAAETRAPGSVPFVEAWASSYVTRYAERDGDDGPALVFGDQAVEIAPLPDEVALHVWFTHAAMAEVWKAFAQGSTAEVVRAVLRRERLWQSFNDITYSLYPWEQVLNRWFTDYGELDQFPGWLAIVAHPSVAIEVGTFGHLGTDQLDDTRASEVFLIEFGAQFLRRPGGSEDALYKKGFGIGAVLGLADDRTTGYGALLHYGTTIHVGALYRDGSAEQDHGWNGLVGLDLYGLLRRPSSQQAAR